MTPEIQAWILRKVSAGILPNKNARILEVGSRNVNGGVRHFFNASASYCGVDIEAGPGVDKVISPYEPYEKDSFDLVLCLEVLEHDPKPWVTLKNLRSALKINGILVISVPTNGFPEHRYPLDCFRYLRDSFPHFFFEGMNILALDQVKCPQGYLGLIGAAKF